MRNLIPVWAKVVVLATVVSATCTVGMAQKTVYDNSTKLQGTSYSSTNEFGDQITLSESGDTKITSFQVDYYLNHGASGDETARIFLYANDGQDGKPGSLLFDSISVANTIPLSRGYDHILFQGLSVSVPQTFTWTIKFGGVDSLELAALLLSNPPTVGSSYDDYWENVGGTWITKVAEGTPFNFSAQFSAVPEPTMLQYGFMAGLAWLGIWVQRRSSSKRS
jgi:hypothetical protein